VKNAEATKTEPKRRSICILTNAYPDFPDSNRVVFIRAVARLLHQSGFKTAVVAPRIFSDSKGAEFEHGIMIRRFESFLENRLLVEYKRTPVVRLMGYMVEGIVAAIKCVRERNCDLIHAHWIVPAGLMALIVGGFCRRPVVVTVHGSDLLVVPERSSIIRRLVKYVLNRADAITSVADHLTEMMVEMGIPREKILTFPMSVPTESFGSEGDVPAGWDQKAVAFSNRSLYPLYNVETLVRAAPLIFEKARHAEVVIAGEGPERERLESLANELGVADRVKFIGAIPHERMPHYLRGSAVYVSTALSDGASVSLLEAMACGAFPVVADIPANREWIEDGGNGFLFPPENPEALAEKVLESFDRDDLRVSARDVNAHIIEQRAQWSSNIEKLLALFEQVMNRR
jgi:glycosyltransferase involved in cell wall biosynthesis